MRSSLCLLLISVNTDLSGVLVAYHKVTEAATGYMLVNNLGKLRWFLSSYVQESMSATRTNATEGSTYNADYDWNRLRLQRDVAEECAFVSQCVTRAPAKNASSEEWREWHVS